MDYHPSHSNTDHRVLSDQLIELIARDVHEQWAQERRRQGWTWGEHRDDDKMMHPGIIPYDLLSEDEKEVDRVTVRTVISSLLSRGATITLDER